MPAARQGAWHSEDKGLTQLPGRPLHALLCCALLPDLLAYPGAGNCRVDSGYARQRMVTADFPASPEVFLNLNTPQDKQAIEARLAAARASA